MNRLTNKTVWIKYFKKITERHPVFYLQMCDGYEKVYATYSEPLTSLLQQSKAF